MSDNTPIEWADATVNAINGCSILTPGCAHCYAMKLAGTRLRNHPSRAGLTDDSKAGPVWNGKVRLHEPALLQPLKWRRPRTIFWNAHGDTFHHAVPDIWIDRMFAVMALTPQHQHLVLTKRSARMRIYVESDGRAGHIINEALAIKELPHHWHWPLPNVWLGVSVEDQARANNRIPELLQTPAAGRFLSCEPLLGPIDLARIFDPYADECYTGEISRGRLNALTGTYYVECPEDDGSWVHCCGPDAPQRGFDPNGRWEGNGRIHGVIVGGESGPGSRPMHPDWARQIRDDCAAASVDFHFKQWGNWAPGENALKAQTRTEQCASWWDDHWDYSSMTVLQGEELHRDDEPDLFRFGKKGAGRHLDGQLHDALPWRSAAK